MGIGLGVRSEFWLALGLERDSTLCVPRQFDPRLKDIRRTDLAAMSREEVEAWGWRQHELARELANRLGADSRTSSRPPSSDDPYRRDDGGDAKTPAAPPEKTGKPDNKKAGKRPNRRILAFATDCDERNLTARAHDLRRLPGIPRSRPEAPMR